LGRSCLIVGCGAHAHSVISVIETLDNVKIAGVLDTNTSFDVSEEKSGYPVIGNLNSLENDVDRFKVYEFAIAIGDNNKRSIVYQKLKSLGLRTPNYISRLAFVDKNVVMGDGNILGHYCVLNSMANIGCNNLINTSSIVEHDVIISDNNHLGPGSVICGSSVIESFCLIGAGSRVLPNKYLSSYSTLGAGGVLSSNVSHNGAVMIGVPAREIT
jgi:sugar O-acyltransferase (sialic acid O-acetyltransferase NeuD family)